MTLKNLAQSIFSVCILFLGFYAIYEYKKSKTDQHIKIQKSIFLNKKLKDLVSFEIQKSKQKLKIIKKKDTWFLTQPVKDQASWTEISRWFDELKNQKIYNIKTKTQNIDWKKYALDLAPRVQMTFANKDVFSFSVATQKTFDDNYFIKIKQKLFVGKSYFFNEINDKDFDSFRSQKIIPPFRGHANSLKFKGAVNFNFIWTNYEWDFDKQNKSYHGPINTNRLNDFWTNINSIKITSIKGPVTKLQIKKYQLHKPQLEIQFFYKNKNKNYNLKLSPFIKDKAFVLASHRNFVMEISKSDAKKLIISKKNIYDHQKTFNYNSILASQITIQNNKTLVTLKKSNNMWNVITKDQKLHKVDLKKVSLFLNKIKKLQVAKYKLGKIRFVKRVLKITHNKQVLFKLQEAPFNHKYSWVQTSLWKNIMLLSKKDIDAIFNYKFNN